MNELKRSWDLGIYPPGVTGWDNASNNKYLISGKGSLILNPGGLRR